MDMVPVNYLAVLVAAVVTFVVSWLWYGPIFGKAWMKSAGMGELTPEMKAKGMKMMPVSMVIQFIGTLLMAYVLAHSLVFASAYTQTTGIAGGLMAGFWSWLGFVAPVTVGMVLWEGRPWKYWMIVAGNWLVNLLIIGAILASWM